MEKVEKVVKLDPKQKEIIKYYEPRPLTVEAGPGSGKTKVIIDKVLKLLEYDVPPENILVITFTRKAAEELKDRLEASNIPRSDIDLMQISTIHGFCAEILKKDGATGFDVIDDDLNEKTKMFVGDHLEDLGFVNEFTIPTREIGSVVEKYNEYTTFKVNTEKLVEYIKANRPIHQEYLDYVKEYMDSHKGRFPPKKEIDEDDVRKEGYYNARYLKVAESYNDYLKLLEDEHLTDFSLMQVNTLEYLEKFPKTPYTHILIDEFQDTDPVQMKIFEILMDNAEFFMVVGDMEQSIYGFRGAHENYFKQLYDDPDIDIEHKDLSYNYRSTEEIIEISEDFIKNQRDKHISKDKAEGKRKVNRDTFYMVSDSNDEEAEKIVDIIEYLYNTGAIDDYNEVGILLRSVKKDSNCINPLIKLLEEKGIPHQVKGRNDLLDRPEIKSFLTLFYYVIKDKNDENKHIFNQWECDWLNLRGFTGKDFPQVLVNLSDETKEILNNLQDDLENQAMANEVEIWNRIKGKKSGIKSFRGLFNNRDDDILKEVFKDIEFPSLENKCLLNHGITNQDDLTFFFMLNGIRDEYFRARRGDLEEGEEAPTILEVFLKLLTISDYLDEDFINDESNRYQLENLAILSNTLFNFEQLRDPNDLAGAFWFLYHNIEDYGSFTDQTGVQIMTVHKAKGLEFPVVIVGSIHDKDFPMEFRDNSDKTYVNRKPVFYTPSYCLDYKPFDTIEEEKEAHDLEEERIFYVAITRAQDTLILSTLSPNGSEEMLEKALKYEKDPDLDEDTKRKSFSIVTKGHPKIQRLIDENTEICKPLHHNFTDIKKTVTDKKPKKEEEKLKLSFTSLDNYQKCPLRYKLEHNLGFKPSETKVISDGNFMHKVFETVNRRIIENDNEYIGDDEVITIVKNLFNRSRFDYPDDIKELFSNGEFDEFNERSQKYDEDKLTRFIHDTLYYYREYGKDMEILDTEVSFYIKKEEYALNGFIDLIYRTPDGKLGILDYKDTESERKYLQKHIDQLYTYVLGLKHEDNKYKDEEIGELAIYAIKSRNLINDIPVNPKEIEERAKFIEETAINIESCNFSSKKGDECGHCFYSSVCESRRKKIKFDDIKDEFGIPEDKGKTTGDEGDDGDEVPVSSGPKFCSECGAKVNPGSKFCSECGFKLV